MSDWLEKLAREWQRQKLKVGRGVAPHDIAQFENEHGIVLPADFRAYLLLLNGLDNDCDNAWFNFWPLQQVSKIEGKPYKTTSLSEGNLFVFADYSISIYEYSILLSPQSAAPSPVFAAWGINDLEVQQVAPSFSEFISLYLKNDESLWPPKEQ